MAMLLWKKIKITKRNWGRFDSSALHTSSMHSSKQRYRKILQTPCSSHQHILDEEEQRMLEDGPRVEDLSTESSSNAIKGRRKRLSRVYRRNGKWNLQNSPPSLKGSSTKKLKNKKRPEGPDTEYTKEKDKFEKNMTLKKGKRKKA